MQKNKPFSYCFRVYNYDQYLYDVGELRAMGYTIEDSWDDSMIKRYHSFRGLWLHVYSYVGFCGEVSLLDHSIGSERVSNLEYIINELPVFKTISSKAV